MVRAKPTNPELLKVVRMLRRRYRETGERLWKYAAEKLMKPRRSRVEVNVSRINRHTREGETVLVPGKVLGAGVIDHPVNVAAFSFSKKAVEKIEAAGGKCLSIEELLERGTPASEVRIMC